MTGTSRLADVPSVIDPEDVGLPAYFVSHAWLGTVGKLFDTVLNFLSSASEETCVWIDCIAINQVRGGSRPRGVGPAPCALQVPCIRLGIQIQPPLAGRPLLLVAHKRLPTLNCGLDIDLTTARRRR